MHRGNPSYLPRQVLELFRLPHQVTRRLPDLCRRPKNWERPVNTVSAREEAAREIDDASCRRGEVAAPRYVRPEAGRDAGRRVEVKHGAPLLRADKGVTVECPPLQALMLPGADLACIAREVPACIARRN